MRLTWNKKFTKWNRIYFQWKKVRRKKFQKNWYSRMDDAWRHQVKYFHKKEKLWFNNILGSYCIYMYKFNDITLTQCSSKETICLYYWIKLHTHPHILFHYDSINFRRRHIHTYIFTLAWYYCIRYERERKREKKAKIHWTTWTHLTI